NVSACLCCLFVSGPRTWGERLRQHAPLLSSDDASISVLPSRVKELVGRTEQRKGPQVRAFSPIKRASALVVATSNATGHYRSIRSINPRDLHRAVAACIRSTKLEPEARTVMATPVLVTPVTVTIAITPAVVLSGCRHRHRKQRQRCQGDKSCLHGVFSSG